MKRSLSSSSTEARRKPSLRRRTHLSSEPSGTRHLSSSSATTSCSTESDDCALEAFWAEVSLEPEASPLQPQADVCKKQNVVKKQATLHSFLVVQSASKKRETNLDDGVKRQRMEMLEPKPSSSLELDSVKVEKRTKSCPFYKRIPGR